ncbi:MAG: D-2-hydroxyacid dehydrogenase family protein [Granulosicoccus sp.]
MTKPRIAVLADYYSRAASFARWSDATFADFSFFDEAIESEDSLVEALADFNAVGLMRERTPFTASLIERLPKLELIITSGKKNAAIDVAAAQRCGITVCGTESPGYATAELAFLLVMSLNRQLVPLVNALKQEGDWQPVMGRDLRGRTLGILGLGRLGRQLAGFAQAMGMHVTAWSENLTPDDCVASDVRYVSRAELFEGADTVSIHLRHSSRTNHMVGLEDLRRLGEEGYLVNTSRAEIVDPAGLKEALDNAFIAGAATDVFYKEPADRNDWMASHPRILTTPHIGYCTEETFEIFYQQMLEGFEAYYSGSPVRVI